MDIQITIGHVGGGAEKVNVPSKTVDAVLVSVLEELYGSDDEHYQAYLVNSTGAVMTIFDGGLMVWDAAACGPDISSRYYRPSTQGEAVEVLNAFVTLRPEVLASRFTQERPPPAPGLNFLLLGMGEFALHRSAWSGNFTRVKQLVEAGHDVNQRPPKEGTTPIMGAISVGHVEMCRFLIEHEADVTVRLPSDGWGTDNWSLIRLARKEGSLEMLQLLKEAGAPE